jgi:hypothetical protein
MNMRTKIASLIAAGAMTIVTGIGVASPAQAAGSCSLIIPSKVRISTPYQAVTGRLGSNCASAGTVSADWTAYHPTQGSKDMLWFSDGDTSEFWDVYDYWITPARYSWRAGGAYDANYDTVYQNEPVTDVRLGSGAAIATARSGSYVTITTSSSRYAYSVSKWVRWGGVTGIIQYWGSSGWTNLKNAYQSSNGYYTYRFYAPKARSYRVVFPDTPTIWGSVSPSSYR